MGGYGVYLQMPKELSVIIPARSEEFVTITVENILKNIQADTEVIVICDGNWPEFPIADHPRVIIVHHTTPIGQRAATNEGACISRADYILKIDAHCAVDQGFDRKLINDHRHRNWTLIPRMYKLDAFNWLCACGHKMGQGVAPASCEKCGGHDLTKEIIWQPRNSATVS